jgi:hypothetical protein
MHKSVNDKIMNGELKLLQPYTVSDITMRPQHRPVEWTEDKAIALGKSMQAWMKEENNIFIDQYLIEHDLYDKLIVDLRNRYTSFSSIYKKCKKIQEYKLVNNGLKREFDPNFDKFILKNHHNYRDNENNLQVNIINNHDIAQNAWNKRKNTH